MSGHLPATVVSTILGVLASGAILWLVGRGVRRAENPRGNLLKLGFTGLVLAGEFWFVRRQLGALQGSMLTNFGGAFVIAISFVVLGIVLSLVWTPQISALLTNPLTSIFDGGHEEPEARPLYSHVQARRKRGQPVAAVAAVREQLARFPNDFEGVLLLAAIQAEDLKDLPGAEITLTNFCNAEGTALRQAALALTQLADWHLQLAADAAAARVALEKIVARFPGTEPALVAEQRIARLEATGAMLLARHDGQAVPVPEGVHNLGLKDASLFPKPKEIEPGLLAAAHVKHLEQHPQDAEVREKLALIYAQHFRRLDLATMELEQLIGQPNHPARQVAGWLNLLATFQVELGADVPTVCRTLERIVERYPDSPAAEVAQRRLARVNLEIKGRTETASVKLGEYEQRAGLKYGRPGKDAGKRAV